MPSALSVWLRPNLRALAWALVLPAAVAVAGVLLAAGSTSLVWLRVAGGVTAGLAGLLIGLAVWQMRRPRLAYQDGHLLFYLRTGAPVRVPVEVVECFLLGQAPAMLPGRDHQRETASVMVRIAESADEWSEVEVKPALGKWCGGYVTIRGTWCEPLSVDLVQRLNARLAEVSPQRRQVAS